MDFLASRADITIFGGGAGGGKSYGLLLEPVRHCTVRGFTGVIFRRTTPEITNPGALWDESEKLYPSAGAKASFGALEWSWPSGATVAFRHMEHEKDKTRYQGPSFAFIGFDELTHFTETQFWYLVGRNRSTCGVKPYIRATCNPDADSWVAEFVSWWIDQETGYAIPERSGVIRWLQRRDGELFWHDTREESIEAARLAGVDDKDNLPKSVTFIPSSLDDNPALTSVNPEYRANLLSMPRVDQERLLRGNWLIRNVDGAEWPPEYLDNTIWYTGDPPPDAVCRVISNDPSKGRTDKSDFTAFVKLTLDTRGVYWVDADLARMDCSRIADRAVSMCREFKPDAIGFESVAFQELLCDIFVERASASGVEVAYYKIDHGSQPKPVRIRRLTPILAQRKLRVKDNPGGRLLVEQMRQFPAGDYDDGPDALEMAHRLVRTITGVAA